MARRVEASDDDIFEFGTDEAGYKKFREGLMSQGTFSAYASTRIESFPGQEHWIDDQGNLVTITPREGGGYRIKLPRSIAPIVDDELRKKS